MQINSCEQPSTKPYKNLPPPSWWSARWSSRIQLTLSIRLGHLLHPSVPPTIHSCLDYFPNTPHSFLPQGLCTHCFLHLDYFSPSVTRFVSTFHSSLCLSVVFADPISKNPRPHSLYITTISQVHPISFIFMPLNIIWIHYLPVMVKSLWGQGPCLIHCCIPNAHNNPWPTVGDLCATCLVAHLCLTLWLHRPQPARFLCPRGFSTQEYWSGLPCPPPGGDR